MPRGREWVGQERDRVVTWEEVRRERGVSTSELNFLSKSAT